MAYVIFKFVAGVMERIVEQNLLYDFYGELLNDHQKKIYEDAIYNDLSLSEIADEYGISRQGVHDLLRELRRHLMDTRLSFILYRSSLKPRTKVSKIDSLVDDYMESQDISDIHEIKKLSNEILEEF